MAVDHFSKVAASYAEHRPNYPDALFHWLAEECVSHDIAWDCGAGNGQASIALANYFDKIIATDLSDSQIGKAKAHSRVHYRVAPAEASGLPPSCADIVTIAQALHWFDLEKFYSEVRRVLKPNGLIAAWSYGMIVVTNDATNDCLQQFYHHVIGPYWPSERHHVETGYRDLAFPFERIKTPNLTMNVEWTLNQLLGYLRSWSASARYHADTGIDAVDELSHQLITTLPTAAESIEVQWPLSILAGR
jgi:ubiquinone/menaquinone biosynthesis C-methylase UbiE